MVLNIKNEKADRLARDLAELAGMSLTDAVIVSLEDRLELERRRRRRPGLGDIVGRCQDLPVLDDRRPEEIVGFGEHGLPEPCLVWETTSPEPTFSLSN